MLWDFFSAFFFFYHVKIIKRWMKFHQRCGEKEKRARRLLETYRHKSLNSCACNSVVENGFPSVVSSMGEANWGYQACAGLSCGAGERRLAQKMGISWEAFR